MLMSFPNSDAGKHAAAFSQLQARFPEYVETHAAYVFLGKDRAYKIKKPVKLPYLDFSTRELRQLTLGRELEINRLFAPDIYLGLDNVCGEPVLVMNRFPADAQLTAVIAHGALDDGLSRRLGETVVASHLAAPASMVGGASIMFGLGMQLSKAFTAATDIFPAADTLEFHALFEAAMARNGDLLDQRGRQGMVRRCHGDLHCGNIVVLDGQPRLFDAIEFSETIATVDVLYDLAFLLMDLGRRGATRAANIVLNHYLHRRRTQENLSALSALPLFLATRAGVRALVTADLVHELPVSKSLRQRGEALDYFRASLAFLKPPGPLLVCIGGLSGTGKSVLSASLAPWLGAAPGAIHIRSDVERKVLAGVSETSRLPPTSYTRDASQQVYAAMFSRAGRALRAGHTVILDAVFAQEGERRTAAHLAESCGADFYGFWLEASAATLKARVDARQGDASDATSAVVESQLAHDIGVMTWQQIAADGAPADTLGLVMQTLPLATAARL